MANIKNIKKAGDVSLLRLKVWRAILQAENIIHSSKLNSEKISAIYCLTQASGAYVRLIESLELIKRIEALEKRFKDETT
jgi:hypothetical protein